ncbi:uncharacterized protein ACNS7B_013887 [Menidia menidia]
MDLLTFKLLLLPLLYIECCVGQDVLPKGTVEGILMGDVTLKVLTEKKRGDSIIWYFRVGERWNNIATLRQTEWEISDLYKGRASIDTSNGYLTLSSLRCEDSGDYSVSVIRDVVLTGEISLRVRASMNGSTPSSAQPGTTQGFSDCFMSLVGCLTIIVLLLAGLLLFLCKWCREKSRTLNELSTSRRARPAASKCEDCIYQTLNRESLARDHIYSTVHC